MLVLLFFSFKFAVSIKGDSICTVKKLCILELPTICPLEVSEKNNDFGTQTHYSNQLKFCLHFVSELCVRIHLYILLNILLSNKLIQIARKFTNGAKLSKKYSKN